MDLDRFDMIDAVIDRDLAVGKIVCHSRIPDHAHVFEGHFPGHPLVPGTIQTEIMAQAAGVLALMRSDCARMPFLIGVDRARFRNELAPGSEVESEAACIYDNGLMIAFDCILRSAGRTVSEASIRLSLSSFVNSRLEAHARALVVRLSPVQAENA